MSDATKSSAAPSFLSLFQYAFLALPMTFASLPLYIHAPDFYSRNLGLDIGLMGAILLGVRALDAVQDPAIGYFSDKYAPLRFQIICAGILTLLLGMAATFLGPQGDIALPVWFGVSLALATTGFSIVAINLNMIGGFWRSDEKQRTLISSWREAFGLVGLLVASVLPPALQQTMAPAHSYAYLFWLFAALALIGFVLFSLFMKDFDDDHPIKSSRTKKPFAFFNILAGKDRAFFSVCFLTHLAASLPGVLVIFFIRDYLGADALTGLFLVLYFLSGAILMPVWVKLSGRIGKYRAWHISMLLAVLTFIWAFTLSPGDVWQYGIICVLSGTALGADLALPPSILADRVSQSKSEGEATQYYAMLAFLPKIALALASGVSFLILDRLGFVPGVELSQGALEGLIVLYALVPCFIKFLASIALWRTYKTQGV